MNELPSSHQTLRYVFVRCLCGTYAVRLAGGRHGQCACGMPFWTDEAEELAS